MKNAWFVRLVCILVVALAGCSKKSEPSDLRELAASRPPPASSAPAAAAAASTASTTTPAPLAAPNTETIDANQVSSRAMDQTDAQRKFVRTARATFRVKDVYRSALAIEDAVGAHGGFVVKNAISARVGEAQRRPTGDGELVELAEYTVQGTLLVRVPSARIQAFLRAIASQMEFLDERIFEATDVQLDVLRQTLAWQRNQVLQQELADVTRKPGDTATPNARESAMQVRDEAQLVRLEFEDKVAFSTIELTLYQAPRVRTTRLPDVEAVFRATGPGFLARMGIALAVGWAGLLDFVVAMSHVWPLWVGAAAALWLQRLWRRRQLSGRQGPKAP